MNIDEPITEMLTIDQQRFYFPFLCHSIRQTIIVKLIPEKYFSPLSNPLILDISLFKHRGVKVQSNFFPFFKLFFRNKIDKNNHPFDDTRAGNRKSNMIR